MMAKKQLKVYLSEELHKNLKVQAAIEGRTLSDIFEELGQKYIADKADKKSP